MWCDKVKHTSKHVNMANEPTQTSHNDFFLIVALDQNIAFFVKLIESNYTLVIIDSKSEPY